VSIALKELRRRAGRFGPVLVAMTLLVILLVVLGAFLDGLASSQTGVLRAQGDRLIVVADDASLDPTRSALEPAVADDLAAIEDVQEVGWLSQINATASVVNEADDTLIEDIVLVGHDLGTETVPAPGASGEAVVDNQLAALTGVGVGDEILVGPEQAPLTVTELVDDVSAGGPSVWISTDAWLDLAATIDPTSPPTRQVAVVETSSSLDGTASEIVDAVGGVEVATVDEVIAADDVVTQQSGTFQGIIGVTFVVTLLVVALFFVLLTIERIRLYAVMKAIGARSRDLIGGLAAQAVVIATTALVLGIGISLALLQFVPPDLPLVVVPSRLVVLAVATIVVAVLGALGTLRRILRIDPASAIG